MMKKTLFVLATISMMMGAVAAVEACPRWECQYPVNYYGCGCNCNCGSGSSYGINYAAQESYCSSCGNSLSCCTCGNTYETYYDNSYTSYEDDYTEYTDYSDSYDYTECEDYEYYDNDICETSYASPAVNSTSMGHWANVRDCSGNIIGQVNCGDNIQIIGLDSNNSDRVIIYDCNTGLQGSVLLECVCGTYQWDGTGDNGIYNSYIGDSGSRGCLSSCVTSGCAGMSSTAYSSIVCNYTSAVGSCCTNSCYY